MKGKYKLYIDCLTRVGRSFARGHLLLRYGRQAEIERAPLQMSDRRLQGTVGLHQQRWARVTAATAAAAAGMLVPDQDELQRPRVGIR